MARLTPRRRMWTAVGILAALTAVTVGAWGLRSWAPFAHEHPGVAWPTNIRPLVDFVEGQTHLQFQGGVDVRFVADQAQFRALVAPPPRSSEASATLAADAAFGRALGLWSGDVNLAALTDTLRNNAEFTATYVRRIHTFAIWAADGKATLTPVQRADVVIALVGLLDEQQFHVAERVAAAHTAQEAQALVGVDFGESVWVHDRYVARFSTADRTAYDAAVEQRGTRFEAKVHDVPPAYRALRVAPQRLGPAFVTALHSVSPDHTAASFTTDPPTALDQLEMPSAKYLHRDVTEPTGAPPLPNGARLVGRRQLGPFGLYLLAAQALPVTEALTASDGWGDDAVTLFRAGGTLCANGRIVADSAADADRLERALNAWGHARPKEAGALVGRKGTTLLFSACDPGITATAAPIGAAAITQFFGRSDLLTKQIVDHGLPSRSECVAVSAYARYAARDLDLSVLDGITVDCDSSV